LRNVIKTILSNTLALMGSR